MARSLFVAIPLCLGLLGCQTIQLNGSECHHEGTSCDGNVLTQCERDTSYWPDRFALQERDCGDRTCVDLGGDEAFCALDDAPSPLCALQPDGPLCVDNTLIFCRDGYVLRVNECDADHTCSTAGWGACRTPAATLPDSSVPEPDAGGFDMDGGVTSTDECAGVDATLCLSVDSVGRCQGGALVDAWACPEGLFCGHVEGADACYGTPAWLPGVDCPSAAMEGFADTRQSCLDDETRITCHHGLVVDAVPCPGCHELALGGPSFDCPRLLAKPRPRHARTQREHPALGALEYDANLDWWTANLTIEGAPVSVSLYAPPDAQEHLFDETAERLKCLVPKDLRGVVRCLSALRVARVSAAGLLLLILGMAWAQMLAGK